MGLKIMKLYLNLIMKVTQFLIYVYEFKQNGEKSINL